MMVNIFFLILGFVLLTRGADVFVDGAAAISRRLHIPEIIIGLTVVAMGTSAPEAAISIQGALRDASGISIGNIIGSNIANILLILGVAACISTLRVGRNTLRYEMPFMVFITCVLGIVGANFGEINRVGAAILFGLFIVFLGYLFATTTPDASDGQIEKISGVHIVVMIVAGLAALVIGSNMIIESATEIALCLGVSERTVGLSIVAFGTSLPELSTCVSAAIKKKSDLVIGNIIGSNIFNILFVLGIAGMVETIPFDSRFVGDTMFAILMAIMLWVASMGKKHELGRFTGVLFVVLYVIYIVYIIVM